MQVDRNTFKKGHHMNEVEKLEQLRLRLIMMDENRSTESSKIIDTISNKTKDIIYYLKSILLVLQIITLLIGFYVFKSF